jgi:rhodanese-related sulfurtransferase
MKKMLLLSAATMLALSLYAGEYPEITIDQVKSAVASKKVTLLDANGTESWKHGHIPGAVDFASSKEKLATVLPKDKNALIVAYCGGPKCHAYQEAAKAAEKLGYTNIKHLTAGISGWKDTGQAMEHGS